MTTKKRTRTARTKELPRPARALKGLADHYDTHDTAAELGRATRVDPEPMVTTSLRLPATLVTALKGEAREESVRYTALLRRVLEEHVHAEPTDEMDEIRKRLAELERQVGRTPTR